MAAGVVADDSKIQYWKQFTTRVTDNYLDTVLLLMIQRYNTESNSQHVLARYLFIVGCCWWFKDTILKAIHNCVDRFPCIFSVVADDSKIQYWKQFTTIQGRNRARSLLLLMIQRYNTESNSQPISWKGLTKPCCCWWFKDTILKAIHN